MKTVPPCKSLAPAHVWRYALWTLLVLALSVPVFAQATFLVVTKSSQALSAPAGTYTYYVSVLPGDSITYNAASIPPNVIAGRAGVGNCASCPSGREVHQLLGHAPAGEGTITYNDISVPNPGKYDVTFVYFCGKNDSNGDTTCGGQPHTASGCRPAIFVVNGVQQPGVNQFTCYPGPWSQPHMQTFSVPFMAGSTNSLHMFSNSADMADQDRIIVASGPSSDSVTLSVSSMNNHLPAGATISWCSTSVIAPCTGSASSATVTPPAIATLTISTGAPTGTYPFVINGQFGSESETASTNLAINTIVPTPTPTPTPHITPTPTPTSTPTPTPDFSISVVPTSQTIDAGSSGAYTVTVTGGPGFSSTVNLSVSGLPTGATGTFSPASLSGGSSTLTVSVASNAPAVNSATLTITGMAGSLSHSQNVTLSIPTGIPPTCVSTTGPRIWTHTPFATQTGTFTAQFDATPMGTGAINDVVGLSNAAQTSLAGFPILVSFSDNPAGQIVARNGGSYTGAIPPIPYTAGKTYHFRLVVNVPAHTYSIFVTPPGIGATEVNLGKDFLFRTGVTPSSLNSVGSEVDAAAGTLRYCNFTIN